MTLYHNDSYKFLEMSNDALPFINLVSRGYVLKSTKVKYSCKFFILTEIQLYYLFLLSLYKLCLS